MPNPQYEHLKKISSNGTSFGEKKQVWLGIPDIIKAKFDAMLAKEEVANRAAPSQQDGLLKPSHHPYFSAVHRGK